MFSDFEYLSINQLFESQVERTPDAVAVVFKQEQLTYQELNYRANQLAHYLRQLGVGPEVLVGICVERSLETIVGLLGILKAGGAYIPLDPAYPIERLNFILEDAQASVLLTQTQLVDSLPKHQARVICIDDWQVFASQSQENPSKTIDAENLAYTIYTSGSTGKPKGVQIVHRAAVNFLNSMSQKPGLTKQDILLAVTTISFDIAALEIFLPLSVGARVVLVSREVAADGLQLSALLETSKATVMQATPATWELLLKANWQGNKQLKILCGGEALTRKLANQLLKRSASLWNMYGPTETTIWSTVYQVEPGDGYSLPIGRPIDNTQIYLLDDQMQPVPVGATGNLYIGGDGLARGYFNRPDLTSEKFIPNPFSDTSDRIYKTGDLARYLPNGNIEYIGRGDNQVKIRGFRIELGEIEAALCEHHDVQQAAVIAREDVSGDKRLIAYIVSNLMPDRLPYERNCIVKLDGNRTLKLHTEDLSLGGVSLVGAAKVLKQGQRVRLRFQLPTSIEEIELDGQVAWQENYRAGIQFLLSPTEQILLRQSVEYLLEADGLMKVLQRTITRNLRNFLSHKLPNYMVPSSFMLLLALPLTPNGKIDRGSLPAPDRSKFDLPEDFSAPRNPIEKLLSGIWAEVLHIERVGIYDNFWELGGHSLLATQIISRIRDTFAIELPVRSLFDAPTVAELAQNLETDTHEVLGWQAAPIQSIPRNQDLPLSFGQQQLWFLAQLEPDLPVYNETVTLRFNELLNIEALEKALNAIVSRHEALRTTFNVVNGQPVQIIQAQVTIPLAIVNLQMLPESTRQREALQVATQEARRPFNLTCGPLLRATLIQLGKMDYSLSLTLHHIIFDGISLYSVFLPELTALYTAFSTNSPSPLLELPIQYADFAYWERQGLGAETIASGLNYWEKQLADLPVLQLPSDRPRPAVQTFRGAKQYLALPKNLTEEIKALSRQQGVTLFTTLLAAFNTLLYRYTNSDDIVIGTFSGGRKRPEIENLIGYFVNTLVLRSDLSNNPNFRELLARVQEVTLAAYSHQDVPFDRLVEKLQPERNLSQNPLFQVAFVLETPITELNSSWSLSHIDVDTGMAKFDLTLQLQERPQGIIGFFEYNTDLYNAETIARIAEHFQILIAGMVANPEQRLSELPMLTASEQQQLLEWNNTQTDYAENLCIHQMFEARVEQSPNNIAVIFENEQLTYQELNSRANQLASYLRSLGVGPEVLVGICMERSFLAIVSILGVLKAGGAYLPLDPVYPQERLAFMIEDSQVSVLLTQDRLIELPKHQARVVCLDSSWDIISQQDRENVVSGVRPNNLAYVIYTSGSTGKPKGVLLEHQGVCNLVKAQSQLFDVQPNSSVLQFASLSFDASVWEIIMALVPGATLVMGTRDSLQPGPALIQLLRDREITHVTLPPSVLAVLPADELPALQTIIVAGEACSPDLVARWSPGRRFFNAYGPTEATVCATAAQCTDPSQKPPIGHPLANKQIYILDDQLQPVPVGVPGELYIGGVGLARGYMNRPDLTAQRFIPNPFSEKSGVRVSGAAPEELACAKHSRLYKSGDLVRYLPDGNIEYIGRIDNQVKVRGFRIELGEIEALLQQHPEVQQAAVIVREDVPGHKRLVAYVVPNLMPETDSFTKNIRNFLAQNLPEYMVPSSFVMLETLPISPNGKIDRRALPRPDIANPNHKAEFISPRTPLEEKIASLWTKVLGVEKVGIADNFFELGGNSLRAAQLINYVRETLQVKLPVKCLFEQPTLEGLAGIIETLGRDGVAVLNTAIDFKAEVFLDPEIYPKEITVDNDFSNPSHIFLTGATGFLGAFLVDELLNQTDAKIYCLVRCSNSDEGLKKLQKNLEKYSVYNPSFSSRVIAIPGNLESPLLGMSAPEFEKLATQIDTIYHGGAQVNFVKPYSILKAANVSGTQEVIRLACQGKVKPIHYFSTGAIFGTIGFATGVKFIPEDADITDTIDHLYQGYTQSKWVAENILSIAKSRGLPISIFRLGLITGHSTTGLTNTTDFVSRLIKGCIQMGSFPDIDEHKYFMPVDFASRALVHLAKKPESLGKIFHLVSQPSTHFVDLFNSLASYGYPLKKLPYSKWEEELIRHTTDSQENALYPLLPLLTEKIGPQQLTIPELYQRFPNLDTQNVKEGLADSDIVCPPLDDKLLDIYISHFINSGFIEPPLNKASIKAG